MQGATPYVKPAEIESEVVLDTTIKFTAPPVPIPKYSKDLTIQDSEDEDDEMMVDEEISVSQEDDEDDIIGDIEIPDSQEDSEDEILVSSF